MSFFRKLLSREPENCVMRPLYDAIVARGRDPWWYVHGGVPDSLDGRFDMIAAIFSSVVIRLEQDGEAAQEIAWLTEIFVTDMDGQLRQIGIGDMVVGKHVGRMMSALGGRIGAYRAALTGDASIVDAMRRNVYRGTVADEAALTEAAERLREFYARLERLTGAGIVAGGLPELSQ